MKIEIPLSMVLELHVVERKILQGEEISRMQDHKPRPKMSFEEMDAKLERTRLLNRLGAHVREESQQIITDAREANRALSLPVSVVNASTATESA